MKQNEAQAALVLQERPKLKVTVYTTPNCVQCEQTKRYLNVNEVEYSVVDLSENPEALQMVLDLGFTASPVVITDDENWSGFKLDNLSKLAAKVNGTE